MREHLRFEIQTDHTTICGNAVGDRHTADAAGVIVLEQVTFATREDEKAWALFDHACGGQGQHVRAFLHECTFLGGVVPSDDQPSLWGPNERRL